MIYIDGKEIGVANVKSIIKELMEHKKTNISRVVRKRNELFPEEKTTSQNLCNKLSRDTLKVTELFELANLIGYNISFDSEEKVIVETPVEIPIPPKENDFISLSQDGYSIIGGVNFRYIIVVGKRADEAAEWICEQIKNVTADADELLLIYMSSKKFGTLAKTSNISIKD